MFLELLKLVISTRDTSMTDSETDRPKIIIDEDWKTKVEREKQSLRSKQAEISSTESDVPGELPPASFSLLGQFSIYWWIFFTKNLFV